MGVRNLKLPNELSAYTIVEYCLHIGVSIGYSSDTSVSKQNPLLFQLRVCVAHQFDTTMGKADPVDTTHGMAYAIDIACM